MKLGAYILSLTFITVFGLLHIDPSASCIITEDAEPVCSVKTTTCQRQQAPKEEKECPARKGCNPFVPCATGSCCYLAETFTFIPAVFTVEKEKPALINDNRLLNRMSECWHPPEHLS